MSGFKWSKTREKAAFSLAEGHNQQETADISRVAVRTIRRWLAHPEFSAEVDRLTHMVGIATRAERLRIAMRVVRQKNKDGQAVTEKDLLEWLKFAQSETDGVKLDLTTLAEAAAQMADRGPRGTDPKE